MHTFLISSFHDIYLAHDNKSNGLKYWCTLAVKHSEPGRAALKLNRKFIGIEKDAQTFEIAIARIKNCCYLDNI